MSIKVLFFRVNEFVKFGEFDENLPAHTKLLDTGTIIPTYDYYWYN